MNTASSEWSEVNDTGMSCAMAAWLLAEIASEEGRSELDVTALEMGARRLSAKWFQRQLRRARRLAGDGSPHQDGSPHPDGSLHQEPLSPEEELDVRVEEVK